MREKAQIPFWVQIIIIISAGILISLTVLLVYHEFGYSDIESANITEKDPVYTVTFAWQDGTIIDTRQAHTSNGVDPPTIENDLIFRGWSAPINNVNSDFEVHPMLYEINDEDENLFCFDSVYVHENSEFAVNIELRGSVNITKAELEIEYDPNVMEYRSSSTIMECSVFEEEPGRLLLKIDSDAPIVEEKSLTELFFFARAEDVLSTQITLSYVSAETIQKGETIPATVTTLNNNIYYLQEVG